jgi:hypothetical protein
VQSILQTEVDPLIEDCSSDFRSEAQKHTVSEVFKILSIFPSSIIFPDQPDTVTVDMIKKRFEALDCKIRCNGQIRFSNALSDKLAEIVANLSSSCEVRFQLDPLLGKFLFNLPIQLIPENTVTGISEISRRHDQNLLTEKDETELQYMGKSSYINGNGSFYFIKGSSVEFLKKFLHSYAKGQYTESNEHFINLYISGALDRLDDEEDIYHKLIALLDFYKDNYQSWDYGKKDALYCILSSLVCFVNKHPTTNLLIHDQIGTWICGDLKDHILSLRNSTYPPSAFPPLFEELELHLKHAILLKKVRENCTLLLKITNDAINTLSNASWQCRSF